MDQAETHKIKDFVDHLLGIQNVKGEPLLVAEGMILNFIVQNMDHLKATFKTKQFFPHLEWNDVLQVILSELYDRVSGEILPYVDEVIETADLEVMNKVSGNVRYPADFQKQKLHEYMKTIFKNKDVRYNFQGVMNILKYNVIEKYITEIFKSRDYLYNELVRVQKTFLECDEYIVFMKILLLLKNAGYVKIPQSGAEGSASISLQDSLKIPGKAKKFINEVTANIRNNLPNLPEKTIKLALKANLKENLTELEDASSRFLYIMATRYANYKHMEKIDRGAESPDKSWFAVARKNADYYGFDRRMLEELYRIAGDNNW